MQNYRIRLLLRVFGVEASIRIRMKDLRARKQLGNERAEVLPGQAMSLISTPKRLQPGTDHLRPERPY